MPSGSGKMLCKFDPACEWRCFEFSFDGITCEIVDEHLLLHGCAVVDRQAIDERHLRGR